MPQLIVTSCRGETKAFNVRVGTSVMEVGRDGMMGIEGACGGCLSCATCHVVIDPAWFERTGEISDDEDEMLDMVTGRMPTSRLGCQIRMSDDLNGLAVTVPEEF